MRKTRSARWNKMPRFSCRRQGFSLIELMVVIAIVGVIAGISAPPIFKYVAANRLQANADRLAADLQYARALSISTSTILRFTSTPGGYQLTDPVSGDVIREKQFGHDTDLGMNQTADFYPWGMADATVFNISNHTGNVVVNLMLTGIVEVE